MAKKIKTLNQFAAPSEGVQAGAPVETPAPKVRTKKNGDPFKVRGPIGPRIVDQRITDLKRIQEIAMAEFKGQQDTALKTLRKSIELEAKTAKSVARAEKKLLAMNPEEQAWMAKAMAAKLAAAGAPELEQHP